ncbi:MAG: hypothetical protein L6R38_001688 [Xanthoria sp. 2 TBL-2021]|nr:MAG: hypothetical protein L6R38_001688 [Xanthoria sp. 2 TBL-2021]
MQSNSKLCPVHHHVNTFFNDFPPNTWSFVEFQRRYNGKTDNGECQNSYAQDLEAIETECELEPKCFGKEQRDRASIQQLGIFNEREQEELLHRIIPLENISESFEEYIDYFDTKNDEEHDKRLKHVLSGHVMFGEGLDGLRRRWLTGGVEKWQMNARNSLMSGENPEA